MKRGQLERLIAEVVADAVKPLVAENKALAAKLAATEAEIVEHANRMAAAAAAPPTPRPSRWKDLLDTGVTAVSRFN